MAADGSAGEMGSEGNRLLVGREALAPITGKSASEDLTIIEGKRTRPHGSGAGPRGTSAA